MVYPGRMTDVGCILVETSKREDHFWSVLSAGVQSEVEADPRPVWIWKRTPLWMIYILMILDDFFDSIHKIGGWTIPNRGCFLCAYETWACHMSTYSMSVGKECSVMRQNLTSCDLMLRDVQQGNTIYAFTAVKTAKLVALKIVTLMCSVYMCVHSSCRLSDYAASVEPFCKRCSKQRWHWFLTQLAPCQRNDSS